MGLLDGLFGRKRRRPSGPTTTDIMQGIIKSDEIDERTRQELLTQFGPESKLFQQTEKFKGKKGLAGAVLRAQAGATLQGIISEFNMAKEGTLPKFKSRMGTQQLYNALVDRPDAARLRGQVLQFGSSVRK